MFHSSAAGILKLHSHTSSATPITTASWRDQKGHGARTAGGTGMTAGDRALWPQERFSSLSGYLEMVLQLGRPTARRGEVGDEGRSDTSARRNDRALCSRCNEAHPWTRSRAGWSHRRGRISAHATGNAHTGLPGGWRPGAMSRLSEPHHNLAEQ